LHKDSLHTTAVNFYGFTFLISVYLDCIWKDTQTPTTFHKSKNQSRFVHLLVGQHLLLMK